MVGGLCERILFAFFLISICTWKALAASCADDTCASGHGSSMLQISKHSALKGNDAGDSDMIASGIASRIASGAHCGMQMPTNMPATKEGYQAIKDSCCLYAMAEFVKVVAETYRPTWPHMNYTVCGKGFAPGVAVWHGCAGDGKDRTFDDLLYQISNHSDTQCTAIAKPGETCEERPRDCLRSPGSSPVDCGCSRSKTVALNFSGATVSVNNLGGLGPDSPDTAVTKGLTFKGIGTYGGLDLDLEVKVVEAMGNTYTHAYYNKPAPMNGIKNGMGNIVLDTGSTTKFKFTFKSHDGVKEIQPEIEDVAFTLFDIDGGPTETQFVRVSDISGYALDDDTDLTVDRDAEGEFLFQADPPAGNVDNPKAIMDLTPAQRKLSVMLLYKKVSSFELTFGIQGAKKATRRFFFAGMSSMGDHCAE